MQLLMDSTFTIKDKESKVNKIIGIVNEVGTSLEKILILCPYSPKTLATMKKKKQ